ncbi:MAG: hypothetical protein AAGI66_03075 [Cyanobacteria bacterium P01_H01_bin.74]
MVKIKFIARRHSMTLLSAILLLALANQTLANPVQISQAFPPLQDNTVYQNQTQSQPQTNTDYSGGYGSYSAAPVQQPYNAPPATNSYNSPNQLRGYVMTAPAGSVVNATVSNPVSSEYARVGDRFMATLSSPLVSGGGVVLPSGSQVEGQVVMSQSSGRAGRNGQLDIRFTTAIMPTGQRIPLSARIQTEDGTGILKGGTSGGRLKGAAVKTGVGAGAGAVLGTALGPLSGGSVGRGAIYGTAVGAGLGAITTAWQKGKPAIIEAGQPLSLVLDQPVTVSPAAPSTGNFSNIQPQPQPSQQPGFSSQQPQPYQFYGN